MDDKHDWPPFHVRRVESGWGDDPTVHSLGGTVEPEVLALAEHLTPQSARAEHGQPHQSTVMLHLLVLLPYTALYELCLETREAIEDMDIHRMSQRRQSEAQSVPASQHGDPPCGFGVGEGYRACRAHLGLRDGESEDLDACDVLNGEIQNVAAL